MKILAKNPQHKLGVNQKEIVVKSVRQDPNIKQSRDVREDRGERQAKTSSLAATKSRK